LFTVPALESPRVNIDAGTEETTMGINQSADLANTKSYDAAESVISSVDMYSMAPYNSPVRGKSRFGNATDQSLPKWLVWGGKDADSSDDIASNDTSVSDRAKGAISAKSSIQTGFKLELKWKNESSGFRR